MEWVKISIAHVKRGERLANGVGDFLPLTGKSPKNVGDNPVPSHLIVKGVTTIPLGSRVEKLPFEAPRSLSVKSLNYF